MTKILAIESSTTVCSVAICDGKKILAVREVNDGYKHASSLTVFIEEVLKEAECEALNLSAVAVSKGPGSYTGLRIGVSAAKGICFAHNIPLIGISAIEAMALFIKGQCQKNDLLIPMIDAGRMEVYTAVFSAEMVQIEPLQAKIINVESFNHLPENSRRILIGNGASKFKVLFEEDEKVIFREDIFPSATHLCAVAVNRFEHREFENLAYFEPLYLKEFIAGKPRVKGLF